INSCKALREPHGKEPKPHSRSLLEALTQALDTNNGPEGGQLIDEFNLTFGSIVLMEYDKGNFPVPNKKNQVKSSTSNVEDLSQLWASIAG
ncbi:hypothetical protein DFH28DRAFT_840935, partial [Melampsora americana]